ncbi:hypothetical protein CMI37_26845 [Candidatus Pacearchaeota archaeon]|nr:hypothetical protein [Candidatus Pacearchaeota archaeon]|tara:strand:+ start:964 stop:1362 length:399 start_codon:yes stop_codon:yes gene_type:complete
MVVEFITNYPVPSLIVIAIGITFISTLVTKWVTNQEHLKSLKKRQKELQKELKDCKDDCKIKEIQMEVMKITGTMMKSSFKPMFITIIPFLILFAWLKSVYTPLMGFWGWFGWYLGSSIIASLIFRKVLKMA